LTPSFQFLLFYFAYHNEIFIKEVQKIEFYCQKSCFL